MTLSKITRQLKLSAFTLVACAAIAVLSADQASAQSFSGNRGFSGNSGRGISLNIGRVGFSYGYGGGRGYSGYSRYNSYRPSYQGQSYYRPSSQYYGNRGGYYGRSGRGRY